MCARPTPGPAQNSGCSFCSTDGSTRGGASVVGKVGPDGQIVLDEERRPTIDVLASPPAITSRCFLDVSIGGRPAGKIVIELWGEVAPRAVENFRALCTGEKGYGYAGSSFYTVLSGLTVQGGQIAGGPYSGSGPSYAGPTFAHDNYAIRHNTAGLVSMVNSGKGGGSGQSDSRFLIQLAPSWALPRPTTFFFWAGDAGFLDGRYEAFGRVAEGMEVVRKLEAVPVSGTKNRPLEPCSIDAAGELPRAAS
ncbi:putative cyclophilin type peptidyl-prolyl cis-trans isomerase [Emiliania huxleyi CCMP1516]|uniref:Peptidyl-prolyl cis-trans isomerase n=2 Tax=Emiliania huxleyi TaxID=2903 RepID=A0A0D3KVP2_EMIH1|nr:putative cyclophilin type peptidyl-prolyl cis-trans isomerase [Emiliania huxleyi CCMP1516]EOD39827.1 putative cyclophilin type peptidyl-prolyl cis-trans isomerase [Emiliania huxleyi CCMP1516]|eukprot:XP_005792256.1 putative cyclophilin type peptidyl-prolyl cis-trans isomerase [Emiliania huxleyi CCMP1516]